MRYARPSPTSEVLSRALRAHKKGRYEEARRLYAERLQHALDCLDATLNLGALEALAGRAEEAIAAFERAAELAPDDGRVCRDIGLGLFTIGRLDEAVRALERAVACEPGSVGSWLHLARIRLETSERRLAIEAAENAVRLRPLDPSALLLLARCVFDPADPSPALSALEQAQRGGQRPEAEIFHSFLVEHCRVGRGLAGVSDGAVLPRPLPALALAHPQLSHLVDALTFLRETLPAAELFASTRDTLRFAMDQAGPGPVVELGVFHGVSLRWLAAWRPGDVHGFDSFEGLPSAWERVPRGRFTAAGRAPTDVAARLWVGAFEEQLPRFVEQCSTAIALLHVDSDIYESAATGLSLLAPLLQPGSVLVFDEYFGQHGWRQHEYRAFQEAAATHRWTYRYLAANPFSGQVVVQIVKA